MSLTKAYIINLEGGEKFVTTLYRLEDFKSVMENITIDAIRDCIYYKDLVDKLFFRCNNVEIIQTNNLYYNSQIFSFIEQELFSNKIAVYKAIDEILSIHYHKHIGSDLNIECNLLNRNTLIITTEEY